MVLEQADFESKEVAGQLGAPEFQMLDSWIEETAEWGDLEGEELGYLEENSVMMNLAY